MLSYSEVLGTGIWAQNTGEDTTEPSQITKPKCCLLISFHFKDKKKKQTNTVSDNRINLVKFPIYTAKYVEKNNLTKVKSMEVFWKFMEKYRIKRKLIQVQKNEV